MQGFRETKDILKIPGLRVGIYNRCSTTKEAQNNALDVQVKESIRIAKELNWQITGHYIEQRTGTSIKHREEYKRMLEDLKRNRFDVIMAKSQDRLMRNNKEWYELIEELTRHRKQLYLYLDNMVYDCDDNGFVLGIMMQLHSQYSRNLSIKIREAHEIRQRERSGLNITTEMFGWDKIGKDKFIVNEREAFYYRKAYELLWEGKGYKRISDIMYEKYNVVSKRTGQKISQTQWRNMLTSQRAYGTVVLKKNTKLFGMDKRQSLPESEWVVINEALPPIVSREFYEDTMKMLSERQNKVKRTQKAKVFGNCNKYPLSGKIYCEKCGAVFYRLIKQAGQDKKIIWKCSNSLKNGKKNCDSQPIKEKDLISIINKKCEKIFPLKFMEESCIITEVSSYINKMYQNDDVGKDYEKELLVCRHKQQVLFNKLLNEVIGDDEFVLCNTKLKEEENRLMEILNNIRKKEKEVGIKNCINKVLKELTNTDIIDRAKTYTYLKLINKLIMGENGNLTIELK